MLWTWITSWHLKSLGDSSGKNWLSAYCSCQAITLDLPPGRIPEFQKKFLRGKFATGVFKRSEFGFVLYQFWVEVVFKVPVLAPTIHFSLFITSLIGGRLVLFKWKMKKDNIFSENISTCLAYAIKAQCVFLNRQTSLPTICWDQQKLNETKPWIKSLKHVKIISSKKKNMEHKTF